MAYDKIIDSSLLDANLTSVAEAIREKTGLSETFVFPDGFVKAVEDIETVGTLYEGEYTVTPKVTSQTLETKDRHMVEDVQIKEIPYYDASNISGGITVYIGEPAEDISVTDDGYGNLTVGGVKEIYADGDLTVLKTNGEAITGVIIQ